MLKKNIRTLNKKLDESAPAVHSHADWDHGKYKFDSESYNYDNYEVAPIEYEQSAYLSMCALANYSQGAVASLGSVDVGSVQNVNLSELDSHMSCVRSIGSTMEATLEKMGNALNVRYTAEMEAAGLFGGEPGQLLDIAGYLRGMADENSSDILKQLEGFGDFVQESGQSSPGMQYDESVFTDPEKLASTYGDISKKDPSTWTDEEKYIVMAYYDDLSGRAAAEKAKADEAGIYSYDPSLWDNYNVLAAEQKALEKTLKAEGMMEYSGLEKGWQEIKSAGKALLGEGADVLGAVKDGDWKGAWRELNDFNNQLQATGAVVTEATTCGVLKLFEYIDDGGKILLTTATTPATYVIDKIAGTDITGQNWDKTMDDVARDRVGEARDWFLNSSIGQGYRDWTNENSAIARDGAAYGLLEDGATKVGEIALAAGITVATGGAAAPLVAAGLGFLEGTGQEAERRYNLTDENGNYTNRSAKDTALSYLKGIGKASEWYMYANVAGGLANKGAETAVKEMFTGNNAKDALLNMAKKADVYIDVAASAANATTTRLTTGKWNWGELGLDLGLSLLGNYGAEYLTAVKGNKALASSAFMDSPSASQLDDARRKADDVIGQTKPADTDLSGLFDDTPTLPNNFGRDPIKLSDLDSVQPSDIAKGQVDVMDSHLSSGDHYRLDGRFDSSSTLVHFGKEEQAAIINRGNDALNATLPNGQTGLDYLHSHGLDPNITSFEQLMEHNGEVGLRLPDGSTKPTDFMIGPMGYEQVAMENGAAFYARQGIDIDAYKEVFGESRVMEFFSTGNFSAIKEAQARGLNIVNTSPDNFGAFTLLEESAKFAQ